MTDRISLMTRDELEAATRALLLVSSEYVGKTHPKSKSPLMVALNRFSPSPLDKVREFLKTEGWVKLRSKDNSEYVGYCVIQTYEANSQSEGWAKR